MLGEWWNSVGPGLLASRCTSPSPGFDLGSGEAGPGGHCSLHALDGARFRQVWEGTENDR